MTMAPRAGSVAIVITTYNHASFLEAAIRSALEQSVPADQIIVVDDGSTDHPERVTDQFSAIRSIRQSNAGLSAARNTGWRAATTEFVVFLDADDRLMPSPTICIPLWRHQKQACPTADTSMLMQ
jgi:glycosyltransferase involved in cell wall biosynthesis